MKLGACLAFLLLLAACLILPQDSEAARMGGGRSFGSRPSMSQPAQAPAMRQGAPVNPGASATASKPGMGGMLGGLAGGLLAGTLLGSLLSGNGMGGGGFMDILLIAILAFIGWKLFTRFRSRQISPQGAGRGTDQYFQSEPMRRDASPSVWSAFQHQAPPAVDPQADIPADFDTEEFLKGAKAVYIRMQKSWDMRDLNDISQFATPSVMRELQNQAAEDPGPSQTEIMTVNAQVAGVEAEGDNLRAQVYFDVLMREDPRQGAPADVREIWHFLRIGKNGNWKLDGIQQVN